MELLDVAIILSAGYSCDAVKRAFGARFLNKNIVIQLGGDLSVVSVIELTCSFKQIASLPRNLSTVNILFELLDLQ